MPSQKEQLSTWLSGNEADDLRALAAKERRSVSQMIRVLVLEAIDRDKIAEGAAA